MRPNGATVFRIAENADRRRISLDQIAVVNLRTGNVRCNETDPPKDRELRAISDWISDRQAQTARDRYRGVLDLCDRLGETAHWLQTEASQEDLDRLEPLLLVALHDVRRTLMKARNRRDPAAASQVKKEN